ncbi:hypothetical protein KFE96_07895 [Kordiimonas sp. SCSIO 12603]|uniref:hypothetical protein n=1 Tax=Kordiimonas sp. SCSIO 12603 TaxID=2829596 RepID=UPI00210760D6|nr:hypothetical protein [Kordiimonas sp. SCSIO 12603]UTW60223.1 hypothetical protein KFE96_07895 [Kordiimonas sp. SCSIO 12603]
MTDYARERFEELKAYVDNLPKAEFDKQAAKGQVHNKAIFDMIRKGDALGVYCSVKQKPSLLEKRDDDGMTPLHWSGSDKPGVMQEILTSEVSNSPWVCDRFGRLPLDVLRDGGHHTHADKMERLTYPRLFRDEKDGPVSPEKIKAFDDKSKALGRPDTRPPFANNIDFKSSIPRLKSQAKDRGDLER